MDIAFLNDFAITVIIGICLCLGYVIKISFNKIDNKYIPLIMAIVGVALNVWLNCSISPNIILGGLFSGLSSTGLHELFRNTFIKKEE